GGPPDEGDAGARRGGLDHRRHLQGPVVRRAPAPPRDPALRRGPVVGGTDSRQPPRRRYRGLSRSWAAFLPSGGAVGRRPEAFLGFGGFSWVQRGLHPEPPEPSHQPTAHLVRLISSKISCFGIP